MTQFAPQSYLDIIQDSLIDETYCVGYKPSSNEILGLEPGRWARMQWVILMWGTLTGDLAIRSLCLEIHNSQTQPLLIRDTIFMFIHWCVIDSHQDLQTVSLSLHLCHIRKMALRTPASEDEMQTILNPIQLDANALTITQRYSDRNALLCMLHRIRCGFK